MTTQHETAKRIMERLRTSPMTQWETTIETLIGGAMDQARHEGYRKGLEAAKQEADAE